MRASQRHKAELYGYIGGNPAAVVLVLDALMTPLDLSPFFEDDDNTIVRYTLTGTLPTGVTFDTATGIISGTPTVATPPTEHVVSAEYSGGAKATSNKFTIEVPVLVSVISAISIAEDVLMTPVNTALAFDAGTATLVSSGISPALPAGMIFTQATAVISGTPTDIGGPTSHIVTVVYDSGAIASSAAFDVTITA